ncbi:MAG: sulfatase-like hydrolase/transferase, partial [Verrucomicrobiae bacterium]|nr:sulfatase-like hydrolase/transferase [Verrucomicrobiae bacterium]
MIQSPLLRLHFAALAVTAAFGSPALLADDLGKPNIVFILADDQGYGDVTALNSNGKIPTPNIDRIAREGMFFTDAHT